MPLDPAQIASKLTELGAQLPCHRCGGKHFSVVDNYSLFTMQEEITGALHIGGPAVPIVLVACANCGAITPHALGALGMLPDQEEANNDE